MANIVETETWDDGVYQLETTDPVQGGADGVDNAPHKNLANRTLWLKAQVALRALLNGSNLERFKVADAVLDDEAVNKAQVQALIAALVDSSPAALDTLNELAAALGDDPNFATTVINALATKAALAGLSTQTFSVANGTADTHAVNKLQMENAIANSGKVLQVVSFTKTDFSTLTSSSFLDTGIQATITPKKTTSKILVLMSVSFGIDTNDSYTQWKLQRDNSDIGIGDASVSATRATFGWHTPYSDGAPLNYLYNASSQFTDSPNSILPLTYKIVARARYTPANSLYINKSGNVGDANRTTGISTITLLEIGE